MTPPAIGAILTAMRWSSPCLNLRLFRRWRVRRLFLALVPALGSGCIESGGGVSAAWEPLVLSLGVLALVISAYSIRRLREAEAARARAERRYRDLFEAGHEAVVLFDHTGKARQANPAFLALTGYEEEALDGRLASSDLVGDLGSPEEDVLLRCRDQSEVSVRIRALSWPGRDPGEAGGGSWLIQDRSREHAVTEALEETQQRLRYTQRLDTLGRLAGGVAHDFNNILTSILGYALLAKDNVPPDEMLHQDLEEIVVAAERARDLTSKLLTFSRQMPISTRPLNLNAVILGLDNLLRRTMGESIELVVALDERIGSIEADPGQLEQVLLNLAVNARDAMPTGGILRLETSSWIQPDRSGAEDSGPPPEAFVRLEVEDSGVGIPPALRTKVFEPFFTTKDEGQGSGFGLVTVQGIVEQYGGTIAFETEVDQGTTFTIDFPALDEPDQAVPVAVEEVEQATGDECIMVVEDQPAVLRLTVRLLREAGYRVLPCANGQDALSLCERAEEAIDMVLSDVVMPKMNGPEVVRLLRERQPHLKALFMSGFTDAPLMDPEDSCRPADFVRKPFNRYNLLRKVRSVLDKPSAA